MTVRLLLATAAVLGLSACESLPHDGPSARLVQTQAAKGASYAVVDLDYAAAQTITAHPARPLAALAPSSSSAPIDRIGQGDVLAVAIYEASTGPAAPAGDGRAAGDRNQGFANLEVDSKGTISIPFAGDIRVEGLTRQQAAAAVQQALRGRVVNPQVLVTVSTNLSNSVTVMGEARNPGRFGLSASNDRLLDVLAQAGGATRPAADTLVTVSRGSETVSTSLDALLKDSSENIRLAPRDQVRLLFRPRKFSAFGAVGHAAQTSIEDESLSLAGALSRLGGLDPAAANASQVMVFRFERPEVAQALGLAPSPTGGPVAVIYRLNLRAPEGYFIAGRFPIEADDLIYAPRADATEVKGFFDLVSSVTRVTYDLTVANLIR